MVAVRTDRLARVSARCHHPNPSAHRAFLVSGTLVHIAILADRPVVAGARMHLLNLSTFGAFLVSGKVTPAAVRADQLFGLTVKENFLTSFTDTANTFHGITSFRTWFGFVEKKSEVTSLTLTKKLF